MFHCVIVNFRAKENLVEELKAILKGLNTELIKVEGCKEVAVYEDVEDLNVFIVVEKWASKSLHDKHIKNLEAEGALEKIGNLLAKPMLGKAYIQI